jgi:hypothetical protein
LIHPITQAHIVFYIYTPSLSHNHDKKANRDGPDKDGWPGWLGVTTAEEGGRKQAQMDGWMENVPPFGFHIFYSITKGSGELERGMWRL